MSEEIRDILPEPETPEISGIPTDPSDKDEPIENPGEPESSAEEAYTIAEYLQGLSDLLSEKALRVVLAKRHLKADIPIDELTEKELDMAEAEVYYQLCNLPVGGSTTKDVDGTWSHTEGGWTVSGANIAEWWKKYTFLREKWGEKVLNKSTIRVHTRGMRIWRRR